MKSLLIAAAFALPTLAAAQDLPDRPIARGEVTAAVKSLFARMDANRDGVVTASEFQAYRQRQAAAGGDAGGPFGHVGSHWFEHADTAGTGRITLAQAEQRPLELFDMVDVDHDGTVSLAERKMAEAMRSLMGK